MDGHVHGSLWKVGMEVGSGYVVSMKAWVEDVEILKRKLMDFFSGVAGDEARDCRSSKLP